MPNLLPFAPPASPSGWHRLARHLRWHFFEIWLHNRAILVPECKRSIALRVEGARLVKKGELPATALLCKGCTASRKAREL